MTTRDGSHVGALVGTLGRADERHNGEGHNVAFADGHAQWRGDPERLYELPEYSWPGHASIELYWVDVLDKPWAN
ncbi:MAG: hypothetical protein WDZ31_01990 [Phycisphaeraceae bacterium]